MAQHWRDDEHGRRNDDGRREGDDRGYGYGAREGGGSERAYRDRADQGFGDREGRFGRSGAGPVSDDRSPRFGDDDGRRGGTGQRYGREADFGNERSRGGFPGYGDRVGYLDRGVSGEPGYEGVRRGSGGAADFGSNSGAGFAGQRRGDYGNTPGGDFRSVQGGFHEREAGPSYGTRGWETDDTPTWRQINRNHANEAYGRDRDEGRGPDYAPHFAGYGGAQMYDGGQNRGREDRLGGLGASREGYSGRREDGYGGEWGAFGQGLSGPGRREDDGPHRGRGPRGWTRSDERIREDVHERLTDDSMIDAGDVTVEVQGGEVTLNGLVDDRQSKRRAEDLAERVSGVLHVQNNLRVRERQAQGAPGAGAAQSIGAGQALGGGDAGRMGQISGSNQPNAGTIGGRGGSDAGAGAAGTGFGAKSGAGLESASGTAGAAGIAPTAGATPSANGRSDETRGA